MAEAIFSDMSLIPVINRFGIALGVGDLSVDEVCSRYSIDPAFFLAVVNTFLNETYFPSDSDVAFPVERVLDYLTLTDEYYARVQLPNIGRHFKSLLDRSPGINNLHSLSGFFAETEEELIGHIKADEQRFFPLIRSLFSGRGLMNNEELSLLPVRITRRGVAEKVADLAAFFVRHLRGDYDRNLCFAVLSAVEQLARDISQNNRIRERLLVPKVEAQLAERSLVPKEEANPSDRCKDEAPSQFTDGSDGE